MMWRRRELLGEAKRSLGFRHVGIAVLLLVLSAGVGLWHGQAVAGALQQALNIEEMGGSVWVATAEPGGTLKGVTCEALNAVDGVAAAGAMTRSEDQRHRLAGLNRPVSVAQVTPNALRVWGVSTASSAGPFVGSDYESLGLARVGSVVVDSETGATVTITSTLPTSAQSALHSAIVVTHSPVLDAHVCWARMLPGHQLMGEPLLRLYFPDPTVSVAPQLRAATELLTPTEQWAGTLRQGSWVWAGIVGGGAVGFLYWTRRQDMAVLRTFGTMSGEARVILATESLLVHLAGWYVGLSVALLATAWRGVRFTAVYDVVVRASSATILVSLGISMLLLTATARGDLLSALKGR